MFSALVLISGASALALEVLWIRDFALSFGTTAAAAAVVLSVYFTGLAAGAVLGGRLAGRPPLATYAWLEAGAALLVVAYLGARAWLPLAAAWVAHTTPGLLLPLARTALATVLLLIPTTLLGATLPVVAAAAADAAGAGRLYVWNTLGGAAGALAAGFVLLPGLGMRGAFLAASAAQLAVAAAAAMLAPRWRQPPPPPPPGAGDAPPRPRAAVAVAAVAGASALAAEVLWTRGLSGVLSASVYSVALVLAATLCGIVAGSAVAVRGLHRRRSPAWLPAAAGLAAVAVLGSTLALRALPRASLALAHAAGGAGAGLAAEVALALLVVFVPSAAIGAILPLTLGWTEARNPGRALAGPLAANTAAGVGGALAGAFVLLPALGLGGGLLVLAGLLAALSAAVAIRPVARWVAALGAAGLLVAAVAAPPLAFPWRAGPDEHVVLQRDGPTATVLVTVDSHGDRRLRVNGQYALGGGDGLFLERREALLPLFLHPAPRRLLHLGVGTGNTLGAAMASPGLTAEGVELVSDALDATALFADQHGDLAHDPRVTLVADDARSVLLASHARWDLILVDLVLPWTAGAGALFSREFYELGLQHLAPGGLLCQWLPLHQLRVGDLESIIATFTTVFPHVQLWIAYHRALTPLAALVGSAEPIRADAAAIEDRLRDPRLHAVAASVGLDDAADLGLLYVTDGPHLRAAVQGVPPITDDRPRIEFSAPRAYYEQEGLGRAALAWLTARLDPAPAPVAGAPPAPFALRAQLLRAQLALLAGDRPLELRAYLDALALAPHSTTVGTALAAIADERRRAGDEGTAAAITRAVAEARTGAAH
jgi:spermidine synthase